MQKREKKNLKTNFGKIQSTSISDQQTEKNQLEETKDFLHKLIDEITPLDYVEFDSKIMDATNTGEEFNVYKRIHIHKKGNVCVNSKDLRYISDDEDDDFDDGDEE